VQGSAAAGAEAGGAVEGGEGELGSGAQLERTLSGDQTPPRSELARLSAELHARLRM
jgi:hypothetical protein